MVELEKIMNFGCVWNGIIYNKLWKVLYLVVRLWAYLNHENHFSDASEICEILRTEFALSLFIIMLKLIQMMNRTHIAPRIQSTRFLSGNLFHISRNQTISSPFISARAWILIWHSFRKFTKLFESNNGFELRAFISTLFYCCISHSN